MVGQPRSQDKVGKFNNTIISKLKYIKLEDEDKFNVIEGFNKAINIYNNISLSIIKIEPEKAFHFKKKKDLNRIINNNLKFQIKENKNSIDVKKGNKALLCSSFIVKGKNIKEKNFGKKIYDIPGYGCGYYVMWILIPYPYSNSNRKFKRWN